ncbi:MAG: hypothetical protein Q8L48_37300 [Archangium sp.]|nr:hypothetical protein [Archangium sp.]
MKRFLTMTVLLSAWAHAATPPSVQECVVASGAGQEHLKQGALFSARQELELCSAPSCPQVVSADCTRWLEEVMAAMPSINIVVRVGGVDQSRALVRIDGAPWLDRLTGRPQDIEPGEHDVTVESHGAQRTKRLVVVQGEKNRVVVFELEAGAAPVSPPAVTTPAAPVPGARRSVAVPVLFTAGAVAGGLGFTLFGLSGKGRLATLVAQPCAATKTCDPAEAAAISREFIVADVSLVVGLASAVAAGISWWWWASQPEARPAVTLVPLGTSLQLVGVW